MIGMVLSKGYSTAQHPPGDGVGIQLMPERDNFIHDQKKCKKSCTSTPIRNSRRRGTHVGDVGIEA